MKSTYRWLTPLSQQFLEQDYLSKGETLDDRVNTICNRAAEILGKPEFAPKFKENIQKGWYSLSTPIWANFGKKRALNISCYGQTLSDNMESILSNLAEMGMMTKHGGGTSAYFGNIRPRGSYINDAGKSSGSVHFMQLFDKMMTIVSQSSTRRGNFSAYTDIDHGDIEEFLEIRSMGNPLQDLSLGICVPDYWMKEMIVGDSAKRKVWAKVLECRAKTGYPYISFIDTINRCAPEVYKNKRINAQNLCAEICLPSDDTESFVCDLASLNILYYDEWKNTNAVELLVYFLDANLSEFIEKAKPIQFMDKAVRFSENHRAIGIGQLGWCSHLQSKSIAFESMEAKLLNVEIAKNIQKKAMAASKKMAKEYGEPSLLKGIGRRHTTLLAIAPTKSSAFILGQVSEGIEPEKSNYFIKDLAKGKFSIKNKYLEAVLDSIGENTEDNWKEILKDGGSVQRLKCLSDHHKSVFKTFAEISPKEIIIQASQRQKYIDQGQSLNLMIHPSVPIKDVNALIIFAWENGVKSLYYQLGVNASQEFAREILSCKSCEA